MFKFATHICLGLIIAAGSIASFAYSQEASRDDLDAVLEDKDAAAKLEAKLKAEREKVQKEIGQLNASLDTQIKAISTLEKDLQSVEDKVSLLEKDYAQKHQDMMRKEGQLSRLLGYFQRFQPERPSVLIVSPAESLEVTQNALLMGGITRSLGKRAKDIKRQLIAINNSHELLSTEKTSLEQKNEQIRTEETRLKSLVQTRSQHVAKIEQEEKKARAEVAALAAKAKSLQQLIETLEKANRGVFPRLKPPPGTKGPARLSSFSQGPGTKPFSQAKKQLISPINGVLAKSYGKGEKGLTFRGVASDRVKSPYNGRVEFAGPFKDYEQVVILNVGENYFLLLTGLGRLAVNTGDRITRGDIIGALPRSQTGKSELYLELRKSGTTINPLPWFKAQ